MLNKKSLKTRTQPFYMKYVTPNLKSNLHTWLSCHILHQFKTIAFKYFFQKIIISNRSLKLAGLKLDKIFTLNMLINKHIFNLFICITKC